MPALDGGGRDDACAPGIVNGAHMDIRSSIRSAGPVATLATVGVGVLAVGFFAWSIIRFLPNPSGLLGDDYGLFLPWFMAGHYWQAVNGPFVPPEYVPSFCGGIPFLFNPQSVYWSVPQLLLTVLPPLPALIASWIAFGLAGAGGMYLMVRRTFGASAPAALLAGTIFLLNGFYVSRMVVGHVTFHGVMLLPLIAVLLFARPGTRAGALGRSAGCALLLAYLFYSGGTNTILPMLLALTILALLLALRGRWHHGILVVCAIAGVLWIALCAYKLLPALAFAGNVVRPVTLRMTDSLVALVGGAGVSLFVPQVLAWIPAEKLVIDRSEFEYGVGLVPLLAIGWGAWAGWRRGDIAALVKGRVPLLLALAVLLALPILLSWNALGLRWLVLHLPVVKMMSVMLRFWFAYIPLLCVLTALLLDYLIAVPRRRTWWACGAMALTLAQAASTDMGSYAKQGYDPTALTAAHARLAAGGAVPAITRIADPWANGGKARLTSRNDALIDGVSDYPCYEPMFGYRMEVFRPGRLATGPALEARGGLLNLRDPVCYVFPAENQCRPGAEFTTARRAEAATFAAYRPFDHVRPLRQRAVDAVSLIALVACLAMLAFAGLLRRKR